MVDRLSISIEEVLKTTNASAGDVYSDDFGNRWVVKCDREGFKLKIENQAEAWVRHWTAIRAQLPGLRKIAS